MFTLVVGSRTHTKPFVYRKLKDSNIFNSYVITQKPAGFVDNCTASIIVFGENVRSLRIFLNGIETKSNVTENLYRVNILGFASLLRKLRGKSNNYLSNTATRFEMLQKSFLIVFCFSFRLKPV